MENSLENFIAIPWGASLVYYEDAEDYRVTLLYIGELGPDYPLMYTQEIVTIPLKNYVGYSLHEWSLQGDYLVLYSSKLWYTDWLRLIISVGLSALVKMIVSFLFKWM